MEQLMQNLQEILKSNGLLATITSGSLIVWVVSHIRSIYLSIKSMIITLISFNIHNMYELNRNWYTTQRQHIFNEIVSNSKCLWERNVNVDFDSDIQGRTDQNVFKDSLSKTTYGFSIRWIYGKLCFVNRHISEGNTKNNVVTDIKVFFARKKPFMKKFRADIDRNLIIMQENDENKDKVRISYGNNGWMSFRFKRELETIFTNNDEHIELYNDIMKFVNNKEIYKSLNYPYKYSALIYGVPGSGKSSSILAIASKLNRKVEYVNLATLTLEGLLNKMNYETNSTIFVFEDIDALNNNMVKSRDKGKSKTVEFTNVSDDPPPPCAPGVCDESEDESNKDDSSVAKLLSLSLSDILNITDGLLSSEGSICIFTTNHIEKLDAAFLRSGRMNKLIKFDYMNQITANRMIKQYLGYEVENLKDNIKPAELQEEILNIMTNRSTKENLLKRFTKQ